jgi:hypothetical protein
VTRCWITPILAIGAIKHATKRIGHAAHWHHRAVRRGIIITCIAVPPLATVPWLLPSTPPEAGWVPAPDYYGHGAEVVPIAPARPAYQLIPVPEPNGLWILSLAFAIVAVRKRR